MISESMKRKADESTCVGCGGEFTHMNFHLSRRPKCKRAATRLGDQVASEMSIMPTILSVPSQGEKSFQTVMRTTVVEDLSDFRCGRQKKIVSGAVIDDFKEKVTTWMSSVEANLVNELEPHISKESGIDVTGLIHSRLDIFNGIHTAKLEQKELVNSVLGQRFVDPVKRMMPGSTTDFLWDLPLVPQLQAKLTYDPSAAAQILESSRRWSASSTTPPMEKRVFKDIEDGDVFQTHAKLGVAACPLPCPLSGVDAILTAWEGYYDEVECTNPLGVARGTHAIGAFYVSCINFDPATRSRLENTFLVCLANVAMVKKYGMLAVLAGAMADGSVLPVGSSLDTSLGGQMRALDAGVVLQFPANGWFGGAYERTVYGWTILMSADYPAAAKMLCTAQSTSSKKPCRLCDWEKDSAHAYAPSTFVSRPRAPARWKLRTFESTEAIINEAKLEPTKGKAFEAMRVEGIYRAIYAFHPNYFPHLKDPFKSSPQDGMHGLFSSGIANSGLAETLYVHSTVLKDFTVDELNDRIEDFDWPPGSKPPPVHPAVLIGARGGIPLPGANVRYTGSQTMHFVLHSRALLEPLVRHVDSPAWLAWLAMVDVVQRYVADSFTHKTIMALDAAIAKHHRLYQKVPEYKDRMRPKHHFLTHTASDIINFGPPRLFWCFGYEAKNQEVKRAACASNFKDVIKSATKIMALQAAKSMKDCM